MGRPPGDRGGIHRKAGPDRLRLYQRAQEAVEYLMECQGHTELTKAEFASVLAGRYGRMWLRANGEPNRRLVEDVMNLTRDQDDDPTAKALLAGYRVAYAPSVGGMTLIDPTGEMRLDHQLHLLSGDIQVQQGAKTMNRRRVGVWRAAAESAMRSGDFDLGRVLSQMENEIDATGFVSDSLVAQYMKLLSGRGWAAA